MKVFIFSILLLLCFSGCEYKEYSADVIIERDGAIYSTMPDEINEESKYINWFKEFFSYAWYYGDDDWNCERNNSCEIVDSSVYNFLVVIPIKSKNNLGEELRQHSNSTSFIGFDFKRCNEEYNLYNGSASFTFKVTKNENDYYHYNLYSISSAMAARMMMDNISDLCLKYDEHERKYEYRTDYTSNEITIKAEEIKDMLDNLGIYYEDESN